MSKKLAIRREKVAVGDRELHVQSMSLRQAEALAEAAKKLDLSGVSAALRPVFESSTTGAMGAAIGAHSEGILDAILDLVSKGSATTGEVAAILLDIKPNYDDLKKEKEYADDLGDAETGRFGVYLGSDGVREWVGLFITPEQAIDVIKAAVEVSNLAKVGKALTGLMKTAGEQAPAPTAPAPVMTQ